ncbi:MAG: hypothetical protein R3Y43_04110 [Alphaproteobacteria bacterium]
MKEQDLPYYIAAKFIALAYYRKFINRNKRLDFNDNKSVTNPINNEFIGERDNE